MLFVLEALGKQQAGYSPAFSSPKAIHSKASIKKASSTHTLTHTNPGARRFSRSRCKDFCS